MKVRCLFASALVFCFALFLVLPNIEAGGGKKKKKKDTLPASSQPGKEHKMLRQMAGNWKAEGTVYMDPKNPTKFTGKLKRNVIMGGRFVREQYSGDFLGKKFQGIGYVGYDRVKKKYVSFWIDSMTTSMMHSEGDYDPESKTITMVGDSYDPKTEKPMKMKMVSKIVSNDMEQVSMYGLGPDGKSFKMMDMTYTRVAKKTKKKKSQ